MCVLALVGATDALYARSVQAFAEVYVAPLEQLMLTVSSLAVVHRLLAVGAPVTTVGVDVQVPGANAKLDALAAPRLAKVTVVTCEPPGVSGVAVPPYLLIVVHVKVLSSSRCSTDRCSHRSPLGG